MPKKIKQWLPVVLLSSTALIGNAVYANTGAAISDEEPVQISQLQHRAHQLLNKAVEHVRQNGTPAVNDFNHDPAFIDQDLYVYSLSPSGQMLSSGGWSAGLIGQNVLEETDDAGQPFFKQMLKKAQQDKTGSIEYYWFNPNDGKDEIKITYFEVVDGILVAVGFFPGLPTEEQAKQMLEQAVSEYFADPKLALRKFSNLQGAFRRQDQYVFVLDKGQRQVVQNLMFPETNTLPVDQIRDVKGQYFLREILDQASPNAIQEYDYWWLSPETRKVQHRRAFFQQVGDQVIAVGTTVFPESTP